MTAGEIALRTLLIGGIIVFAVITGFAYTTLYERKLLARIKGFDFGAKDVDTMVVTWPVDFLPS